MPVKMNYNGIQTNCNKFTFFKNKEKKNNKNKKKRENKGRKMYCSTKYCTQNEQTNHFSLNQEKVTKSNKKENLILKVLKMVKISECCR